MKIEFFIGDIVLLTKDMYYGRSGFLSVGPFVKVCLNFGLQHIWQILQAESNIVIWVRNLD